MMRRLGDNPTDEELRVMVAEVDQVCVPHFGSSNVSYVCLEVLVVWFCGGSSFLLVLGFVRR